MKKTVGERLEQVRMLGRLVAVSLAYFSDLLGRLNREKNQQYL